jgi:hypothetical protein
MTRQHIGLLLTVIGAALLAFSVSVKSLYGGTPETRAVREAKKRNPGLLLPTEARNLGWFIWSGLLLIFVGAYLQW